MRVGFVVYASEFGFLRKLICHASPLLVFQSCQMSCAFALLLHTFALACEVVVAQSKHMQMNIFVFIWLHLNRCFLGVLHWMVSSHERLRCGDSHDAAYWEKCLKANDTHWHFTLEPLVCWARTPARRFLRWNGVLKRQFELTTELCNWTLVLFQCWLC